MFVAFKSNRTLILPPLYIGKTSQFHWANSKELAADIIDIEDQSLKFNKDRKIYSGKEPPLRYIPWSSVVSFLPNEYMPKLISIGDFLSLNLITKDKMTNFIDQKSRNENYIVGNIPGSEQNLSYSFKAEKPGFNKFMAMQFELCLGEFLDKNWRITYFIIGTKDDADTLIMSDQKTIISPFKPEDVSFLTNSNLPPQSCSDIHHSPDLGKISALSSDRILPVKTNKVIAKLHVRKRQGTVYNIAAMKAQKNRTNTLIFFNSLFQFEKPSTDTDKYAMSEIQRSIKLNLHPVVKKAINEIETLLGGPGCYASTHIRGLDGHPDVPPPDLNLINFKLKQMAKKKLKCYDSENSLVGEEGSLKRLYVASDVANLTNYDYFKQKFGNLARRYYMNSDFEMIMKNVNRMERFYRSSVTSSISWQDRLSDLLFTLQDYDQLNFALIKRKDTSFEWQDNFSIDEKSIYISAMRILVDIAIASHGRIFVPSRNSSFSFFIDRLHRSGLYFIE